MGYIDEVLADTPQGFWPLTDPSTTAVDLSGFGRNGTYAGDVALSSAKPFGWSDGCADFSGVDGRMNVADNNAFTSTALSLECWINPDPVTVATYSLISKITGSSPQEWWLRLNTDGYVYFQLKNTSQTTFRDWTSDAPIGAGWHHIVATTTGSTFAVYLDGAVMAGTTTGPSGTRAGNTSAALVVGRTAAATWPYSGEMFGAAFYSYQLSAERTRAHFDALVRTAVSY